MGSKPITKHTKQRIDNIEYNWYPTPQYNGNSVGRVWNIFSFLRQIWLDKKRLVSEFHPDVVIASSTYPMDIWVAKRLAVLAKAKLIFEVHDLWPLSPIELGNMSKYHPFIQICQQAENYAYRNADAVISILPKVHAHMATHGLDLRRLHIIPNGISPNDWQSKVESIPDALKRFFKSARDDGSVVVGYTGAHGLPNALDTMLDAAKLLKEMNIRFLLVGHGHEKARLQRRVKNESLGNVHMFSSIHKSQIPALLKNIDIAFIGLKSEPLFRFGVSPNKLMDYMMAARPIICAIKAGNDPVTEAGCGLTVQPESFRAIANGVSRLAEMTEVDREKMGLKGQVYVQAHHTYPVLARKFVSIMDSSP